MKTSKWQLFRFSLIYLCSQIIVFLIPILISSSSYQGWIGLVAGFGLSLIILMFTVHLGKLRPRESWLTFGKDIVGAWIHRIMVLLLLCWCVYFVSLDIENFVLFFGSNYLRSTSPIVIQCVLGVVIMYTASLGFSTIVYMSDGIFLIFCTAMVFTLFLFIQHADFDMLPALIHYHDPAIALKDSVVVTSWFAEWVVFLFIVPEMRMESKVLKKLMLGGGCVFIIVLLDWLLTLLNFGPHFGKKMNYPLIDLIRSATQDAIISNIDPLMIGIWSSSMFIHSSYLIYVAYKCASALTKERGKKYIIPFLTSASIMIAFIYSRNVASYFIHYKSFELVIIWLFVECIPIYYSLVAMVRFRKKDA